MNLADCTHVFAVPGGSIIDFCHPATGRSLVNDHDLDAIRQRYPDAAIIPFEEWSIAAARQDTPVEWREVSEDRYDEMLNVLPPAAMNRHGFLVGEEMDHHARSGRPRFAAFRRQAGKFYEASRPLTRPEFYSFTEPSAPPPTP